MLRNRQNAEDALQDGLLSAYSHLQEFEGRSQFPTWLSRIVINAALMHLRRSRRDVIISIDQHDDPQEESLANRLRDKGANPEEMCAQRERLQSVVQRWQTLQTPCRQAMWLRYIQGLNVREAAEVLGLPPGALKSQFHRAKLRFRQKAIDAHPPRGTRREVFAKHRAGSAP
jgi:RNA polymerase sigma-70 factor (ECF subfamily)